MSEQPHLEPASRPGPITAAVFAVILLGGLVIFYWPQIKAVLPF